MDINKSITFAALAVVSVGGSADAQVVADRPDFVEAATVVGRGRIQVETSTSFSRSDNGFGVDVDTWATPTLFRIGVSDRVELRVESDWYVRSTVAGSVSVDGFADVAVGAKISLANGEALTLTPATAVLFHVDLPTGSNAFSGTGARPSARFVAEWELPGNVGLGVMPGVIYDNSGTDRFFAGILGVVASKGWTERFRTFAEVAFEQIASDSNGGVVANFDFGGTFALSETVQLDAASSLGLNDRSEDFAVTIGLSAVFGL